MLSRLMEIQIWHPPVSAVWKGGRLNKGSMDSASTSVWEKAAPLALALKPDNSVPLFMSLVSFELLPQCWSTERVSSSMSKSICGPFKRSVWDSSCCPSHPAIISTGFHSPKLLRLLFLALETWAGEPGVRLGPLGPQGAPPQLRYPS